jgi:hypothetical protein
MSLKSKPVTGIPPIISLFVAAVGIFIGSLYLRSSWVNGDVGGIAIAAFFLGMGLCWLIAFVAEIHLVNMGCRQLMWAWGGIVVLMILVPVALFLFGRQSRPSKTILEAMAGVCLGQAEPRAAMYNPGSDVHKLVLLDSNSKPTAWTGALPRAWRPERIEETELVLCVVEERTEVIQTCQYRGGPDIDRSQSMRDLVLLEARTGAVVSKTIVSGKSPRRCQELETVKMTSLGGLPVSVEDVVEWLKQDVEIGQ